MRQHLTEQQQVTEQYRSFDPAAEAAEALPPAEDAMADT